MDEKIGEMFQRENLEALVNEYMVKVSDILQNLGIREDVTCDHIGFSPRSSEEFAEISDVLGAYAELIEEITQKERRIRLFRFHSPVSSAFEIPKLELFEPQPSENLDDHELTIGHVSFYVPNWQGFSSETARSLPIEKSGAVGESKFIKVNFGDGIRIEFRNDRAGEGQP